MVQCGLPMDKPSPRAPQGAAPADDGLRVSRLITERGLASRREADAWIEAGWVKVDGRVAVLGQRAGAQARIEIDPRARQEQAQRVTILLHKPVGLVSGQAEDGHAPAVSLVRPEHRWAQDRSPQRFHPGQLRGLAPAGRLDIDSSGLLVLTQDGRIARLLIGDDSRVEKEYLVRVQHLHPGPLPDAALQRLRHGLALDGRPLRPARVSWANEDQLRFVLREGRKRQIRRMCELVGLKVVGLKRVRIGSVALGALPSGCWRYLGPHERFA
jgi:23S rRNA pseudouridine2604 synthase